MRSALLWLWLSTYQGFGGALLVDLIAFVKYQPQGVGDIGKFSWYVMVIRLLQGGAGSLITTMIAHGITAAFAAGH